jgi:hypothetical protein
MQNLPWCSAGFYLPPPPTKALRGTSSASSVVHGRDQALGPVLPCPLATGSAGSRDQSRVMQLGHSGAHDYAASLLSSLIS